MDAASCRRELGAGSACCGIMPPGKALRCSPWGQERRFAVSCRGPPEKALRCFPLTGLYGSTAEKPPTGRFFWIVRIGSLLGGFSLTKAPSFAIRNLDCKIHPQRRLTIKAFRALRSSTKGFAFGNHSLLKKAGENFILQYLTFMRREA